MVTSLIRRRPGGGGGGVGLHDPRVSFELPYDDVERRVSGLRNGAPPTRRAPAPSVRPNMEVGTDEYERWVERYPHAVRKFEQVLASAQGKKVAVFLDYDGTLTPIVRDPDRAYISEEMRQTVKSVAEFFPTAIISGRGREKVQGFVALGGLYYAGSHGLDIVAPTETYGQIEFGSIQGFQPAAEFEPLINDVHVQLCDGVRHIEGSSVEHNKFCLSVHFRNCHESSWEALNGVVESIIAPHDRLKLTRGRKVLEVRPRVDWDKGRAVEHLLRSLDLDGDDVLPIYLGDDRTDEDAFRFLRNRTSGAGIGVLVSSKVKPTEAHFTLEDPTDVLVFLTKLVEWGKGAENRWFIGLTHTGTEEENQQQQQQYEDEQEQ